MKNIAVLLPSYNEEATIKSCILEFAKELPHAKIVVINNNSNDKTEKIALETFKENKINGLLLNETKQGKANAIRKAFKELDADIYVMVDADMTYPAKEVHNLIKPILENEAHMTIGDRLSLGDYEKENKRVFHSFGNNLITNLVNKLFVTNINDLMSGYRAFSKSFIKNYPILVEGFELETDMTLHALDKRFKIKEIEISYKDRPEGSSSKLDTFRDGFKIIFTIFKIFRYYKPFLFFTWLSFIFAFLSLISAIPVFKDWILYQYIYHVPLAILATGLGLISIIFFVVGIILDAIAHQNRFEFERRMIKN